MNYPFINRDKSNVTIEKILGPESSPSVGRRIIKFQSSKQRNSLSSQICPVRLGRNPFSSQKCPIQSAASGKLFHVLSRQLPPIPSKTHFCPVRLQRSNIYAPSVTTDPIEKPFLSRQTSAIEYLCPVRGETTPVLAAVTTLSYHDGHTQG